MVWHMHLSRETKIGMTLLPWSSNCDCYCPWSTSSRSKLWESDWTLMRPDQKICSLIVGRQAREWKKDEKTLLENYASKSSVRARDNEDGRRSTQRDGMKRWAKTTALPASPSTSTCPGLNKWQLWDMDSRTSTSSSSQSTSWGIVHTLATILSYRSKSNENNSPSLR